MTPREKYYNDSEYRNLVDSMVATINRCYYTPSELREAAVLASIIYEENRIFRFEPVGKEIYETLEKLNKWINKDHTDTTQNPPAPGKPPPSAD